LGKCARAVEMLVDYMNKTPEVKEFTKGWESNLMFDLRGEERFGVVFDSNGRVTFEKGRMQDADVVFLSDADLFYGMMTGRVDQDEAFNTGQVEVVGSIFDSVRFRHAAELTQAKHKTLFSMLKAVSRLT
jgi:putative sterol carrier protein